MTPYSNGKMCTQGYRDYEKSENMTLPKEQNKLLVTNPKKWRSMSCLTIQNNCSEDQKDTRACR